MTLTMRQFLLPLLVLSPLALTINEAPLTAQPKAPPIVVAPQAPTLNLPSPSGAQRGASLELTLTGTNLADPAGVWTSFPAKVSIPTDMNNGKDAAKLRVKLDVPADVPLGFHTIRVATKHGISNTRVICVDELPQVPEVETNRTKTAAQQVPVPCVVMGRCDAEASDYFKINVKAGQRLTFEVLGRRLGSAFDPIIVLHDVKSGREMPGLYSDDAPGLQTDARVTHTFKDAGDYLIEIRDTTHRGGADYFYRLRIGDFPAAIAPIPVAMKRGAKGLVNFAGPAVDGVSPIEITMPGDPAVAAVNVAPKGAGGVSGWPVAVIASNIDELVEQEPNNEPAKANKMPVPSGITGRFLDKGDVDCFVFPAKKGVKYAIVAETYEINSPAEVYLILKNAKNAELGKSSPQNPTARIDYSATEDGDLIVHVEHLNYAHGPSEVYRLTVQETQPDFDVVIGLDRFDVAPGGSTLVPVMTAVRRDYAGPIELSIVGHPGFSGSVTIPAGVPGTPPPPPGTPIAYLPLAAKGDVPIGPYELRIQAKGNAAGKDVIRFANVSDLVKQNMAGLGFPPREMLTSISVGVTDKPVFALAPKLAAPEILRGTPANITIAATKAMGFDDAIAITAVGLPPTITAALKPLPKGSNDIQLQITAAANAPLGSFNIMFRGAAKVGGKDFAYYSAPVTLVVALPFEVKVEPALLSLKPGTKGKVKVSAVRKGGFKGPIDVELKNLPANVSAPKTPIPMDKNEVEIEVTATPAAVAGDKADVNATGIAGKDSATSPNFTVRVEKVEKKDEKKDVKKEDKKEEKKDEKKK
jgi:hypothetical protein